MKGRAVAMANYGECRGRALAQLPPSYYAARVIIDKWP